MNIDKLMKGGVSLTHMQALIKNREIDKNRKVAIAQLDHQIDINENSNLVDIKGIGEATRSKLLENGIKSQDDLVRTGIEKIKEFITSPIALKGIKNYFNNNK